MIPISSGGSWSTSAVRRSIAGNGENAAATGDLDITGNLTIVGAGTQGFNATTIDGNNAGRVFQLIGNVEVEMSGLIITGGRTEHDGGGGGISTGLDSRLTLTDVTVTSNAAGGDEGGGILNRGTLLLIDGTISNNLSTYNNFSGGGSGGGISNEGTMVMVNTLVTNNQAEKVGGGVENRTGTMTIVGSIFEQNRAIDNASNGTSRSGAILNGGILTVTTTIFRANQAESGGAIYNPAHWVIIGNFIKLNISETTFSANSASGNGGDSNFPNGGGAIVNEALLTLDRSTVSDNSGGPTGGGILNHTGALTVTASSIYSNAATIAGGGIANLTGEFFKGTTTLSNSTVSGNFARDVGGGIFNDGFGATLNLSYVTVVNNTVNSSITGSGGGGGIFNTPLISFPIIIPGGNANLKGTLLAGNVDVGGAAFDCGGGQLNSQGYNLVQAMTGCTLGGDTTGNLTGVDPLLGPYVGNGGPTRTHLPQAGSPAIDAGDPANCPATDQRSFPRPVDGDGSGGAVCDIGAVEFGASSGPGQQFVYLPLVVR